jgi:hypothetical protein
MVCSLTHTIGNKAHTVFCRKTALTGAGRIKKCPARAGHLLPEDGGWHLLI